MYSAAITPKIMTYTGTSLNGIRPPLTVWIQFYWNYRMRSTFVVLCVMCVVVLIVAIVIAVAVAYDVLVLSLLLPVVVCW